MSIINIALKEYGVKEILGSRDNTRILQYFKDIGHEWVQHDEMAWCSAFVNWVALQAGAEMSNKLDARSWLNVGCEVDKPKIGDIAVFWRDNKTSWKGHVAFFIKETDNFVYVLGGNQGNQVCIKAYKKDRLLQYRTINI